MRDGGVLSNLVNLKRFKKRTAREETAKLAETNRARFGRTTAEKKRDEMSGEKAKHALDQHRISDEPSK